MLMWAGLLVIGLALGYAASMWLQKPKNALATNADKTTETTDIKTAGPEANVQAPSSPAKNAPVNNDQVMSPQINFQASSDILTSRLTATQAWLASQNPNTVTIQLMGASSEAQLKSDLEVLSQQVELDNIYVYRTKVAKNGTSSLPFLTVLYGSFANRVEAMQALKKLPLEIQKNRPQLRTVAGVLQETK